MTIRRCSVCRTAEAEWAMQPFGPDDHPTFTTLGSHYRGFPVIAVCDLCKRLATYPETTKYGLVCFTYRGVPYGITAAGVAETPF